MRRKEKRLLLVRRILDESGRLAAQRIGDSLVFGTATHHAERRVPGIRRHPVPVGRGGSPRPEACSWANWNGKATYLRSAKSIGAILLTVNLEGNVCSLESVKQAFESGT